MCLLDVNPQSLKILKTSEFVPYIVFVEAPPFEVLVQMHRESAKDNPKKAFSVCKRDGQCKWGEMSVNVIMRV